MNGGVGTILSGTAIVLAAGGVYAVCLPPLSPSLPVPARTDIHAEYVRYASGRDTITAYLAYPERRDPTPAIIVIHEIFGLSDFARRTTERLATDGFVAIAPDLLSRAGGTPPSPDSARALIGALAPVQVTADLDASFAYLRTLKGVRADRVGVMGFCWGGGQSFRYATHNPQLGAFVVCYGPAPDLADVGRIRAPGLGVYAENDARITAALPAVTRALRAAGKDYRAAVYPGTGHGFLRTRENAAAADSAWRTIVRFLGATLGQ